jgi:hypothetical protein
VSGMSKGGWATRPVVAARAGLLALLLLVPLAALVGALVDGGDGALAAVLGLTVPGAVLLLTWAAAEIGSTRAPSTFAALLMGSYLVKLVVVIGLLVLLDRADLASPVVAGVSAIVGLVAALVVEGLVVLRTRAPYVEP